MNLFKKEIKWSESKIEVHRIPVIIWPLDSLDFNRKTFESSQNFKVYMIQHHPPHLQYAFSISTVGKPWNALYSEVMAVGTYIKSTSFRWVLIRIFWIRIWTINHFLKWIHITSFRKSVQAKFFSILTVGGKRVGRGIILKNFLSL